ncbi:hypothetical protein FRC01_002780 [Tulasnella sp. 417]|nr:hypothetical protein FRC01_002780 [Tulasnella sp. 417]
MYHDNAVAASKFGHFDCPRPDRGRKDVADKMILADLMAFAYDNPLPSAIILISGDKDFAYAISVLRSQLYSIILVHRGSNVSRSLVAQPNIAIDGTRIFEPGWEDLLAGLPDLPSHRAAPPHPLEIEDGSVHINEGIAPVQQEAVPTQGTATATATETKGEEAREDIGRSLAPPAVAGAESEPNKDTGAVALDPLKDHHVPLSDGSSQANLVDKSITPSAPSRPENVHSASSVKEGPPPIPPRPPGYPSAKTTQLMPLVDYPEGVSESSDDGDTESNPVETHENTCTTRIPHLDKGSSPPDIHSVPELTSSTSSTVPTSALKEIPEAFVDLVDVLDQARSMGIDYLNPETVEQMVLHRKPDVLLEAHVERFGTYLKLADNQGIVEYNRMSHGVKLKEIL